MTAPTVLAIDQGTSSSRALLFDLQGQVLASHQIELRSTAYPQEGWVEQDAAEIHASSLQCALQVLQAAEGPPAALGIANQRETVVLWERASGEPLAPAIVWQDRRTSDYCRSLRERGLEEELVERTGLVADPYFSASKIAWLLQQVPGARERALAGELAVGTVDCWLVWKLTGGRRHCTDATNASRTQLFSLAEQRWDPRLLEIFDIPEQLLPQVCDSADDYGTADLGGTQVPIRALIGDQQSALVGHGCLREGSAKATYGTGCFLMAHTGEQRLHSGSGLLATVALRLGGRATYALEGSIFSAGTVVQWLRDMGLIADYAEASTLPHPDGDARGLWLVPAFTGLGAPWWNADATGAVLGLTRASDRRDLVTAALQSVCLQTRDLTGAMAADGLQLQGSLRVDGGMVANAWFLQHLADVLGVPVARTPNAEVTALGAARLAALGASLTDGLEEGGADGEPCQPQQPQQWREQLHAAWRGKVQAYLDAFAPQK